MSTILSGPMFEPAKSGVWESSIKKTGAHYNLFGCDDRDGMTGLRQMFADGEANEYNAVLFSTSGVHGTYCTIEDAEATIANGMIDPEYPEDGPAHPSVTFLVIHPRIVCLRYGNCEPQNADDIAFLKKLRESSWKVLSAIGRVEDGK